MKLFWTFLIIAIYANNSFAQSFQEKELSSSIDEVKVFLRGAQITRSGKIQITEGNSSILLKTLSPYIDPASIQVKGIGAFTLLSVNHQLNFLEKSQKEERIVQMQEELEELEEKLVYKQASLSNLDEQRELLRANKNIGSETQGVNLNELKLIATYFSDEFSKLTNEELKIRKGIKDLDKRKRELNRQLKEFNDRKETPTSEIQIRIKSESVNEIELIITYLVENCGWFPKYDLRASSIDKPINLIYKADVYQNTGNDWKNVKLSFSNVNPKQSGQVPQLETWNLNYARFTRVESNSVGNITEVSGQVLDSSDGSPLPGVNVMVKGTTIGTITDINGKYSIVIPRNSNTLVYSFVGYVTQEVVANKPTINISMSPDIQQLQEVVVSALEGRVAGVQVRGTSSRAKYEEDDQEVFSIIETSVVKTQTNVEIELDIPYSIKSDGESYSVDLKDIEIPSTYEYYAVPKMDPDVFLVAKITNWNNYNLLQGDANLYFEGTFIGKTILDVNNFSDTLEVSLGRDKNVLVKKDREIEFSKSRSVGGNKLDTRVYKITVRNNKSSSIYLTVFDQIPVPVINSISVDPIDIPDNILNENTGIIKWTTLVEPQGKSEIQFGYEVKYPKNESVILD